MLYVHWSVNTYTVTFDADGGSCEQITATVTYGSAYASCLFRSYRLHLCGWYTAQSGGSKVETSTTVTIAEDHTLYARWIPKTYTVTLDADGATAGRIISLSPTAAPTAPCLFPCEAATLLTAGIRHRAVGVR
jgi:uncharacterized repeat protein (TIGR02543 family)